MNTRERGRRRFLKESAALASLAVGVSARGQTLELVSKMVQSQEEQKKEGSRAEETRQTEGELAI